MSFANLINQLLSKWKSFCVISSNNEMGKVESLRTILPSRPMAVGSLGAALLLGAGFQPLQAQDDERILYFPHLAVGASWQTTITYINYSPEEVTCQTDFLSDDGNPLVVSFAHLGRVVSRTDVLPPGGSIHEETNVDLSAPLAPGWARATCSGPVKASLLFRRRNSEGVPVAEAAVNAARVPATRFVTFAEQGEGQFGTGVAYANPSATAAVITFTARDVAGQTLASVNRNLPPGGHGAQNMVDLFGLTSFGGSIEVSSTEPIVSLSLNFEADPVFSSLPPGEIDTSLQGSPTYYFPHLAVGASWQTTISYINYSPGAVTCQTDFLSDDGSPLMVSFAGLGRVVSRTDVLPPGGSIHEETNVDLSAPLAPGWARANCSGPVKAGLLFRRRNSEGAPVAEAAVNAARVPATRFVTFAEQGEGQFGTGVAYANPSATAAVITFTARDVAGQTLASVNRNLPPGGHGAQNMVDLFGLTSFGGSIEVSSTEPIVSLSLNFEADPVFSSLPPGGTEPVTDREVLEALYHATNGPEWNNSTNWLSTLPLSDWFGVKTDGSGRVTGLRLLGNGLSGRISPVLGRLTHLQTLEFGQNQLVGTIPTELGRLTNLRRLDIPHNKLSGSIPPELSGLTNLQVLNLGANQLSGWIPHELGQLTKLNWLALWFNELRGSIPPELGGLTQLQEMFLGGNGLSGVIPKTFQQLTKLTILDLRKTDVCVPMDAAFQAWLDTIATFWSSGLVCDGARRVLFSSESYNVKEGETVTVSVRLIDQSGDPVRSVTIALTARPGGGGAAADYSGVPESVTIAAPLNETSFVVTAVKDDSFDPGETVVLSFRRPLPSGITAGDPDTATVRIHDPGTEAMTDREVLEVLYHATGGPNWRTRSNWLSDLPLWKWYGVETDGSGRVTSLSLGGNQLGGAIPPVLGRLSNLQTLYLQRNRLSGAIPPELGGLTHLRVLELIDNQLSGTIPPELGGLTNLLQLRLGGNRLNGAIPPELGGLTNLQELCLVFNKLSGTVPPELGGLTNVRELRLGANRLSGAIPPELGKLAHLRVLEISINQLSGAIPPELGGLPRLQRLWLEINRLSGPIPPELGRLTNLQELALSANQLSGAIPPELGQLSQLQRLDLKSNQLSGMIPPALGQLSHLQGLHLWSNQLNGTIPPELNQLTQLKELNLSFNQDLTGMIPPGLQQLLLSTLDLMATSVCVPEDAESQAWLAGINKFTSSGLSCGRPADAMPVIDIAVFYTPSARRIAGGTAEMEAMIDLMIAETNQAYIDSGVSQQIALVARQEVKYSESLVHAQEDLNRLASATDGHMDGVHAIRDQAGADLVHLIGDLTGVGGIARLPGAFSLSCAACGSAVFAHELGHNMGLSHDRYLDAGYGRFPYSYGYVNQLAFAAGAAEPARWMTVMAYNNQCSDSGFSCARILRFSNSNQTYRGDPLGVPGDERTTVVTGPADGARALNITRHSVAAFRPRASGNRLTLSSTASQARSMVGNSGPAILFPGGSLFRAIAPNAGAVASRQAGGGLDRAILRRRVVTVDMGRLQGVEAGGPTALRLNLFDDVVLTGIIEQWTPTWSGGYALSGRLAGVPEGRVTLVVNGSVVAGTVRLPGATFRIRPTGAGRHAIMQVDPSQFLQGCETVSWKPSREP